MSVFCVCGRDFALEMAWRPMFTVVNQNFLFTAGFLLKTIWISKIQ